LMGKWHESKNTRRYGKILPSSITTFWIPLVCQVESMIKLAERLVVGALYLPWYGCWAVLRKTKSSTMYAVALQIWKLNVDYCQFGYLSPTAHGVCAYVLISCSVVRGRGALSRGFEKTHHILEHGFLNLLCAVDHFGSLVKPTDRFSENIMREVKHRYRICMFYSLL